MIDPISIAIAFKVIALIIALLLITYQLILDWFQENEELVNSDADNIGVTVKELFDAGNYTLVQGVFNTRTDKVVAGRKLQSKKVDDQVAALHRDKVLVVYN
jgi:hypothetical protein